MCPLTHRSCLLQDTICICCACFAQTAGVPVGWVNTTVIPSNSSSGGGGSSGGGTPEVSAGGRRLMQGAPPADGGQDITIESNIATGDPAQVQQSFSNAQSNGQLGKQLSDFGWTLVPEAASPSPPVRGASTPL